MNALRFALAFLAIAILPGLGLSPRLNAKDVDGADLYAKVISSCVYILTPVKGGHAEGSGSVIDVEQKLVVTNYHVVEDQELVFVIFPVFEKGVLLTEKNKYKDRIINQGKGIKGTVLCRDKSRDLAIVKFDKLPEGTKAFPLAKTSPRPATEVWQIGNAGAVAQAFRISSGDVSAVGHFKGLIGGGGEAFELNCKMITATCPVNQGDSGGPLFDKRGYQVGVTESFSTQGKLVSHFVDITEVHALLKEKKITIKEPPPEKEEPKLVTPAKELLPQKKTVTPPETPRKEVVTPDPPKNSDPPAAPAAPSADDEKAATNLLSRAKLFANGDDNRPTYISKLNDIVKKFPQTAAGKDAKKLLDGLK